GTGYDCLDAASNTRNPAIGAEQQRSRTALVAAMGRRGFLNYFREWWHFAYAASAGTPHYDGPIPPRAPNAQAHGGPGASAASRARRHEYTPGCMAPRPSNCRTSLMQETRFSQLGSDQLDDMQKRVAERILKVSSAGLGGPYSILLRSPILAERYLGMTDYLRFETSLPHRLNELAILIEARLWDAQYEWWAHYPIALKAGLSEAVGDDIKEGRRTSSVQT